MYEVREPFIALQASRGAVCQAMSEDMPVGTNGLSVEF